MKPDAHERADLVRAIANALRRNLATLVAVPSPSAARAAVFEAGHGGRCPRCGSREAAPYGLRGIQCRACRRRSSLTAGTPWHGLKLDVGVAVAALWHVHVDVETTSARAFARRSKLRYATALAWLREMRAALVFRVPSAASATRQVLGRVSARNRAFAAASIDPATGVWLVVRADDAPPIPERPPDAAALVLGRVQAWIVDVFRGVSSRYFDHYLAEFSARCRRARVLERALDERSITAMV